MRCCAVDGFEKNFFFLFFLSSAFMGCFPLLFLSCPLWPEGVQCPSAEKDGPHGIETKSSLPGKKLHGITAKGRVIGGKY